MARLEQGRAKNTWFCRPQHGGAGLFLKQRSTDTQGMASRNHLRCLLAVVFAVGLAGLPASAGAQTRNAAGIADGAYRGYLAVRPLPGGGHEVIDSLNADRLFVPASVLKVVTVATALEHLGPEYRWTTRLTSSAPTTGGVLEGDLVIEPGADPTWGDEMFDNGAAEPLAELAQQIRDRGLTRVSGDLVVDTSRFPGRTHPTDRGYSELPYRYGTPTAALAVDEATITVRVAPGPSVGVAARIGAPEGVVVINHTSTVGRERHGAGTLDFIPVWGTNTLLLRGEYPISEPPFLVAASDPAPELRAAAQLRRALDHAGVPVDGTVRLQPQTGARGERTTLAELRSRPLADLLPSILTRSHNWYADMLTLTLAHEAAGSGRFDDGVEVISDFVATLSPDDANAHGSLWIRDGSGLSASNLVTPATTVRVLAHTLGQPWGPTMIGAMARTGAGTLVAWPRLPPISAKTGTLRHTVALAGFVDPGTDSPVVFSYFLNHHPERLQAARGEIASALRRWRVYAD